VEVIAAIFTGIMAVGWTALLVSLVIWWRQGRKGLWVSVLVSALLAVVFPVSIALLLFRPVRLSFIPAKPGVPS
jgi:uncharacterized membrane protein